MVNFTYTRYVVQSRHLIYKDSFGFLLSNTEEEPKTKHILIKASVSSLVPIVNF